jgi:PIN domain nuclease of toxin-antitoxin system
MPDVLLDTPFLLPTLGLDVREITKSDLESIQAASKKVRFHCSYASFVEILGLVGKKSRQEDAKAVSTGIDSLLTSDLYRWINPSLGAIRLALELRTKGHKDNIDNILYATAADSKLLFLSLDEELRRFLARNGYDTGLIVNADELAARVGVPDVERQGD